MPDMTYDERDDKFPGEDQEEIPAERDVPRWNPLRPGDSGQDQEGVHYNEKYPFILSKIPFKPPKKKSKDVVEVTMDETWSSMRTEAVGRPVWYYKVWNATKGHEYTVELFEGIQGEPVAWCNCMASVVCKHIIECLLDLLINHCPTFGDKGPRSEFMAGVEEYRFLR